MLRHLLENSAGLRFGVVVNDLAAVNVDAKLVQEQTSSGDGAAATTVKLQNGCACCSASAATGRAMRAAHAAPHPRRLLTERGVLAMAARGRHLY